MNFREWLLENTETGIRLLYHATLSGANNEIFDSFVRDGIDPERAKGYQQGSGFYLFYDKNRAINHAKSIYDIQDDTSSGIFVKQERVKGSPIIIVVDEPVTPECFDIDYESFAQSFGKFIYDNYDFFERNKSHLNLVIFDKRDDLGRVNAGIHPDKQPTSVYDSQYKFNALSNLKDPYFASPEQGGDVSKFARKLAEFSPEMFNKFESEYLHLSPAIKYNCKKRIWPVRIEDIDGKVLWHR